MYGHTQRDLDLASIYECLASILFIIAFGTCVKESGCSLSVMCSALGDPQSQWLDQTDAISLRYWKPPSTIFFVSHSEYKSLGQLLNCLLPWLCCISTMYPTRLSTLRTRKIHRTVPSRALILSDLAYSFHRLQKPSLIK